jgi:hypothetical protein
MLYKYLPARFARSFVERGEVLFRSLSYFRKVEHAARGDEIEGIQLDAPDNDVTLQNLTRGFSVKGRFRMLSELDQERVMAFCCSQELSAELFDAFGCDSCVVIRDPEAFFLRCAGAARRPLKIESPGLLHRAVAYYAPNKESPQPVRDPHSIPFMKVEGFAHQKEYRAVYAKPGGFAVRSRIVQPQFTFAEEIERAGTYERLLRLGSQKDIAEIVSLAHMP